MSIQVRESAIFIANMRTRMPFRYGIATLTALPHLMLRLAVEVDGRRVHGWAADHLPPKWFTKDPQATPREEIGDMLAVIQRACGHAIGVGGVAKPQAFVEAVSAAQLQSPPRVGMAPLLLNFGISLVERAVIDAFCRVKRTTVAQLLGAEKPLRSIIVRHTVGLADPLREDDLQDGLPQSLAACVRDYGLTHFKIKLGGDAGQDVERLREIADVLGESDYRFTLDGNENYRSVDAFDEFWRRGAGEPMMQRLLFIEQPLHRDVALSVKLSDKLPPVIIDESDATADSLARALECGYAGTSHKNCKGVFKSVAAAKLLERRRRDFPGKTFILSAEDLSNVGPIALLQDLAVVAALGITHAERNGHHYFRGLSAFDSRIQDRVLASHGDLYRRHEDGFATVAIRDGWVDVGTVVDAPFGYAFDFEPMGLVPLEKWDYASL